MDSGSDAESGFSGSSTAINGMKRVSTNEQVRMNTPPKRRRFNIVNRLELRLLIPSLVAGSIIGTKGSNITRLRGQFHNARIQVPESSGPERLVKIFAEEEVINKILPEIVIKLVDMSNPAPYHPQQNADNSDCEVRLITRSKTIGGIIGRRGERIQELRQLMQTKIKIYGSCCPESDDRIISITGSKNNVQLTIKEIIKIIGGISQGACEKFREGADYDPDKYWLGNPAEYGGYEEVGRETQRKRAWYGWHNLANGVPRHNGQNWQGRIVSSHKSERESSEFGEIHDQIQTTQYTVPNQYVGALIGESGCRIRRIRNESGAQISIYKPEGPKDADRIITITGTDRQTRHACYLLQESVRKNARYAHEFELN